MLFQCSWHMCDSGMHLQLPDSVSLNSIMLQYTLNRIKKYLCTSEIVTVSKEQRIWQGKVWGLEYSFHVVPMTREQQRKITFFLSPALVCVLGEELPECSWSRSKLYSISVNGNTKNHPILLGIPPGVIRKTYSLERRLLPLTNKKKQILFVKEELNSILFYCA